MRTFIEAVLQSVRDIAWKGTNAMVEPDGLLYAFKVWSNGDRVYVLFNTQGMSIVFHCEVSR